MMQRFTALLLLVQTLCLANIAIFESENGQRTVTVNLTLSYGMAAPDGFLRQSVLINGQFPGPDIRVQTGDFLVINVRNDLFYEGASIHIHGLDAQNAPQYDGVSYTTQWPILPGKSFTYRHNITNFPGTYWYHSHYQLQSHSVFGAFIIEDTVPVYQYDDERTVVLSDWYHASDNSQMMGLMSPNFQWIGDPQSLLINGRGQFNCVGLDSAACNSTQLYSEIRVDPGKTYRLRLIGATSMSDMNFTISSHKLTIIEADGIYTEPYEVSSLEINSGQRYSVLIKTDNKPGTYSAIASTVWRKVGPIGIAALQYSSVAPEAMTSMLGLYNTEMSEIDPLHGRLKPLVAGEGYESVPLVANKAFLMEMSQAKVAAHDGQLHMRWLVNGHVYEHPEVPLLMSAYEGKEKLLSTVNDDSKHLIYFIELDDVVDVIVQNTVALNGVCEQHPWHLHGYHFWELGGGPGSYAEAVLSKSFSQRLNLVNPLLRDTMTVYPYSNAFQSPDVSKAGTPCGWKVIRFRADNPGIWQFHCHIAAHMHMGMQAVFVESIGSLRKMLDVAMVQGGLGMGDDVQSAFMTNLAAQVNNFALKPLVSGTALVLSGLFAAFFTL